MKCIVIYCIIGIIYLLFIRFNMGFLTLFFHSSSFWGHCRGVSNYSPEIPYKIRFVELITLSSICSPVFFENLKIEMTLSLLTFETGVILKIQPPLECYLNLIMSIIKCVYLLLLNCPYLNFSTIGYTPTVPPFI